MANRHENLISWILEKSANEPLPKRIEVLRAAAELIGSEPQAKQLKQIALELAKADIRCREFAFQFNNADGDGGNGQ
jgi:hypothetical protein